MFGKPGRLALKKFVPELRAELGLDLVMVNCENATNGRGVSKTVIKELLSSEIDGMTSGNHIFDSSDGFEYLQNPESIILRPYNFAPGSPGRGSMVVHTKSGVRVGVINIMGRVFMEPGVNLPFDAFDEAYRMLQPDCDVVLLDFHAETTSEKKAMGWYVDGKVQLMVGTHTHVPTADECILPNGTAYITDLGMCGPHDSVIGMEKSIVIKRMRTGIPTRMEPAENDARVQGVYCEIDVQKKRAIKIERIERRL